MRIRAQPAAADLAPEAVELLLREAALEERARVDARRGVALEEHLVAAARIVLAAEEVVEADLVQAGRAGVRREMTADAAVGAVGAQDHRDRVPADQPPDPPLQSLVTREERLLLGADRVDVARPRERRQPDMELACPLEQLEHQEPGAVLALVSHDLVEGIEPFLGLARVDVGQLMLELVEVHRGSVDARATDRVRVGHRVAQGPPRATGRGRRQGPATPGTSTAGP